MVNKMDSVTQAVGGLDTGKLLEMLQTTGVEFGINLVTAVLIFFIGKWVVGLVVKAIATMMQKGEIDATLERFICSLVRISLMVVVVIAAIGQLGVQTTSLLAVMGAAGLAVGLALQG